MKRIIQLLAISSAVSLTACLDDEKASPDSVYRAYHAKVAEGRTFDEDAAFHTQARREEVLSDLEARAAGSGSLTDDTIRQYLAFTQQIATCSRLELISEETGNDRAQLIYSVTDTCTDGGGGELHIEMVEEDGWKIQSDELRLGGG